MQLKTKWLLIVSILIFPTVVYLFFLQGEANFDKPLEYIGPKTDSNYHFIPDFSLLNQFGECAPVRHPVACVDNRQRLRRSRQRVTDRYPYVAQAVVNCQNGFVGGHNQACPDSVLNR